MVDVEHALIVLRQKRPVSELQVFVPQTQVSELAERPSVSEQAEMAEDEHWLYVLWQYRPVVGVQDAVSPHSHAAAFGEAPSSFGQTCTAEHLLIDDVQKRPVVGVHTAAPQMHKALLDVVPSASEQRGPVAQRL